ncbi:FCD domain-containing protein [Ruania halotolerans]|nr:FCD domain-containing protein [Ruania halotolerans]
MHREPHSLLELLAIRRALEGLSASAAARSATRTGIDLLEATLGRMSSAAQRLDAAQPGSAEATASLEDYVTADVAFHGTLAVVSGNSLLAQLLEGLADALGQAFRESVRGHQARGGAHAAVVQQHRVVVEAVRRTDPAAAAAAMDRHLTETASDLRAATDV